MSRWCCRQATSRCQSQEGPGWSCRSRYQKALTRPSRTWATGSRASLRWLAPACQPPRKPGSFAWDLAARWFACSTSTTAPTIGPFRSPMTCMSAIGTSWCSSGQNRRASEGRNRNDQGNNRIKSLGDESPSPRPVHRDWRPQMHGNPSAPANTPVAQEGVGLEADDRLAYSVNEAAQRLGVGPMTLYREIAEGKLPAIRIRDRVLVPRVVLERLVEEAISRATGTDRPTSGGDVDAA